MRAYGGWPGPVEKWHIKSTSSIAAATGRRRKKKKKRVVSIDACKISSMMTHTQTHTSLFCVCVVRDKRARVPYARFFIESSSSSRVPVERERESYFSLPLHGLYSFPHT